jgi:putative peptide zinc metalloprotease protein
LFGIYTIASFIYRWVVAFGIIMFLNQILKPYGLQSLGRAFAIAGFAGMVVPAVMAVVKFFKTPGKAAKMKQANMLTSLGIALAVLSFICFFPLPFHVYCPTEVRPDNAVEVRTLVAGKLDQWKTKPGLQINSGDEICSLQNPELLIQRETANSDVRSAQTMLTQMRYLSASDPKWSSSVETQESELRQKEETLATLDDKLKNLTVRSPLGGHVFQPPEKEDSKAAKAQEQLPSWSGNPFALVNSDAYFTEGELICLIGPSGVMEGVVVVDQHDRDLVKVGDSVEMMFDAAQLESVKGTIISFSETEMKESPSNLAIAAGGKLDTKTDEYGRTRPISTSYQARVEFDDPKVPLRPGYRGQAKVHLAWKSLGSRFFRYVAKTFNFEF